MPLARPRREDHEDACAAVGRDRTPFVGVEEKEGTRPALDGLSAGLDPHRAVDHRYERVLLDLVLPEALPGLETDQECARSFVRPQYDGRSAATGHVDLLQVPMLHRADPKALRGRR